MTEEENIYYQDLIIKFFAGETDDNELLLLKEKLQRDPENRQMFDRENELWQEANKRIRIELFNTDDGWENISSALSMEKRKGSSVKIVRKLNFSVLMAAASILLLAAISFSLLWLYERDSSRRFASSGTLVETREGEKARIYLADSTEVTLNSGSSLNYDGGFNLNSRNVRFSGEAYFDVATNPEKPFVVQLDKLKISARGTKFNIFSFGNEDRIEATLEEGNLDVEIEEKKSVNLKPGQQIVYFKRTGNIMLRDVACETYTSWKENKLRFKDTPLEEVLRRIGRKYNVKFEITNSELLDLKYTATFIDESIEKVMQMLGTVSPITYKIYYNTSIDDKLYTKPRIVVGKRKTI
jgi:transmembrane sensor